MCRVKSLLTARVCLSTCSFVNICIYARWLFFPFMPWLITANENNSIWTQMNASCVYGEPGERWFSYTLRTADLTQRSRPTLSTSCAQSVRIPERFDDFWFLLRYIAVRVRGRYRSASRQSKRCQRVMTVWQGHGPPRNLGHQSAHGRMFTEACSAGVFV